MIAFEHDPATLACFSTNGKKSERALSDRRM